MAKYNRTGGQETSVLFQDELKQVNTFEARGLAWWAGGNGGSDATARLLLLTDQKRIMVITESEAGSLDYADDDPYEAVVSNALGVARVGNEFVMSDGSDHLHFLSTDTLALNRTLRVANGSEPTAQLTDLEYFGGLLWAMEGGAGADTPDERLFVINPSDGALVHHVDLTPLAVHECAESCLCTNRPRASALAFDKTNSELWIAGSYWPRMVSIDILDKG